MSVASIATATAIAQATEATIAVAQTAIAQATEATIAVAQATKATIAIAQASVVAAVVAHCVRGVSVSAVQDKTLSVSVSECAGAELIYPEQSMRSSMCLPCYVILGCPQLTQSQHLKMRSLLSLKSFGLRWCPWTYCISFMTRNCSIFKAWAYQTARDSSWPSTLRNTLVHLIVLCFQIKYCFICGFP